MIELPKPEMSVLFINACGESVHRKLGLGFTHNRLVHFCKCVDSSFEHEDDFIEDEWVKMLSFGV